MENILTRMIDILEENKVQLGLSYIDEEYGQVDYLDSETDTYPVTFPAVLVDGQGEQWQDIGQQHQKGTANVAVNIYVDCYDDTHAYSTQRHKVEERMQLVRSITELFQGFEPIEGKGRLRRTNTSCTTANHGIKLYQVSFSVPVYESFDTSSTASVSTHNVAVQIKK